MKKENDKEMIKATIKVRKDLWLQFRAVAAVEAKTTQKLVEEVIRRKLDGIKNHH